MATGGKSVTAVGIEVIYQAGYGDERMIAEPAIIIREYNGNVYGIILQGDQEITIGGWRSMLQLAKAIKSWAVGP